MSLLTQRGLTFGSHFVYSFIYMFTKSTHQRIMLEMRLKSEKCVGIMNPCDIKDQEYKEHILIWSRTHNTANIYFDDANYGTCVHVQYFAERLTEKKCNCDQYSFEGAVLNANTTVYYDKFQAQRCMNCSSAAVLQMYELFDLAFTNDHSLEWDLSSHKSYNISVPYNTDAYSGSANSYSSVSSLPLQYACSIDGAFHVTLTAQEDFCMVTDMCALKEQRAYYFSSLNFLCSFRTFCKTPSNVVQFEFFVGLNSQLALHTEFQNLFVCNNNTHIQGLEIRQVMMGPGEQSTENHRYPTKIVSENISLWLIDRMYVDTPPESVTYIVFVRIMQIKRDEVALINFAQSRNISETEIDTECADMLNLHINHILTENYSITAKKKCIALMKTIHKKRIGIVCTLTVIIFIIQPA